MTDRVLRVCGTSQTLPGNGAWDALNPFGTLEFGDYGDWVGALMATEDSPLLWMLFLEDLVSPEAFSGLDMAPLESLILPLLDPLAARLRARRAPVIVAWSAWRPHSVIETARSYSAWGLLTRRFEETLYEWTSVHPQLHVVTLDEVLAVDGLASAFDWRNYYAGRCRLSRKGLGRAITAIASIFTRLAAPAKKLLVLDCDGTLWGDVVGEVGIGKIVLGGDGMGQAYADFQRAAKRLTGRGVLLALASKNNAPEVWEVFDRHSGMALARADIVAYRIDWRDKADNLAAMAEELDLGLDSFVFWDDNPLEREKMRLALPQVAVPEVPADVTLWPAMLDSLELFARFDLTREDERKTEQYRSRAAFVEARRGAGDEREFLRSLDMRPMALPIDAASLGRAAQLAAKTNQFNLRTIRHGEAELAALAADAGDAAFLTKFSDRFGEHGLVGLVMCRVRGEAAFLDSFLLSCRVLGRHLDAWMLACLVGRLRTRGVQRLFAEFIDSGRNAVAKDVLSSHGFVSCAGHDKAVGDLLSGLGGALYVMEIEDCVIPYLDVFDEPAPEIARPAAAAVS